MSGIAGVVSLDGQKTCENDLKKMIAVMAYRGPDGSSFLDLGHVGFVHLASRNLPESIDERLPLQSPDKRYMITFQGRIDNRKEIHELTHQRKPLSQLADSQLVLAAYLSFGRDCAAKLLGDFAFAVWDDIDHTLYCCRDQMGVKPLFFIKTDSFFAFASEIKALLTLTRVQQALNRERLADFLVCMATERRMTIYKDIFKLQPAHFLVLKNNYIFENRYWDLVPYELGFSQEQDYYDGFNEIFQDAVKVRLRTSKPIGSYLSGGIDSSSIVCMASGPLEKEYPGTLHTFTSVYDRLTQCDERRYFQSIVGRYNILPNYVVGDNLAPAVAFDQTCQVEDEPFHSPHSFVSWHLMKLMQSKGLRVLLNGHDGDSALSYGNGLMPELAMQGRVLRLANELMGFPNATRKRVLKSMLSIYADLFIQKMPFVESKTSAKRLYLDRLKILSPELLVTTNVKERVTKAAEKLPSRVQTEQKSHFLNVTQPFHAFALEYLERSTSRFGLSGRYPMFDIRLISFCLSLPAEKKLKDGFNRYIVRKSLHDIMPASVRDRKQKTNFAANLIDAYTVRSKDWLVDSCNNVPSTIYDYMNKTTIEGAMCRCVNVEHGLSRIPDLLNVLSFLSLSKWMEKNGFD